MFTYDTDAVLAYWYGRPLPAREAFSAMGNFVLRLKHVSSLFENLFVEGETRYVPLHSDLSNLEQELAKVSRLRDLSYTNEDRKDVGFALTSFSRLGFDGSFVDAKSSKERLVDLSISCGQLELGRKPVAPNSVILEMSPKVQTPPLLRGLFDETVRFWRPADATIIRSDVRRPLGLTIGEVHPGWLTYIADTSVADCVPADFVCEPFVDGVVILAAERPGTADDPDYMARLFRLRDALRPQGWLSKRAELSKLP